MFLILNMKHREVSWPASRLARWHGKIMVEWILHSLNGDRHDQLEHLALHNSEMIKVRGPTDLVWIRLVVFGSEDLHSLHFHGGRISGRGALVIRQSGLRVIQMFFGIFGFWCCRIHGGVCLFVCFVFLGYFLVSFGFCRSKL